MGQDPEPRETSNTGPFITIEVPGPLEGVVTLTAIEGDHARTVVEAVWTHDGHDHRDSVEADTFEDAQIIAREIADGLAAGRPPDLARERLSRTDLGDAPFVAEEGGRKAGGALERSVLVLGALLAVLAIAVIAAERFGRGRGRRQAIQEWKAAHPDQALTPGV
jgi:hypothetical protein